MDINSSYEARIRETMQFKETEELVEIWSLQDREEWSETTFTVMHEILSERGFSAEHLREMTRLPVLAPQKTRPRPPELSDWDTFDLLALWVEYHPDKWTKDQYDQMFHILTARGFSAEELKDIDRMEEMLLTGTALPENQLLKAIFQSIDWTKDSLDVTFRFLARYGRQLGESEGGLPMPEPDAGENFPCVRCSAPIPLEADTCPACGLELYPEDEPDSAASPKEQARDADFELGVQKAQKELETLETPVLMDIWQENDLENWDIQDMEALRRLLLARGETIPWRFDAVDEILKRIPYLDEKTLLIGGIPGNRVLPGRTGLNPVDNTSEEGRWAGLFLKNLFGCRLRTKNPLYLTFMALLGIQMFLAVLVLPSLGWMYCGGDGLLWIGFLILAIFPALFILYAGVAFFVNLFVNLVIILTDETG